MQPRDNPSSTVSQSIQTIAGEQYTLDFWTLAGIPGGLVVDWNGVSVGPVTLVSVGPYQEQTFTVTGDGNVDTLSFIYTGKNTGCAIDDISLVEASQQTRGGTITFSDPETTDIHGATFVPENNGKQSDGTPYFGTFTLGPVSEVGGSGSVGWQ